MTMTNSIEQDGFNGTVEIVFKDGHHCLAYDLIRTPNISKAALSAVPSNAVAIATFALSADNENQTGAVRAQIKNFSGLDIGREIFANIEQVTVFAVPAKTPNTFFPGIHRAGDYKSQSPADAPDSRKDHRHRRLNAHRPARG